MLDLGRYKGFEWDKGNIDKSYEKHGITPKESEEIFLDENLQIGRDLEHSQKEKRYLALGKTFEKKILFVVFTLRSHKIRIVSTRRANLKERRNYAQKAKKSAKI